MANRKVVPITVAPDDSASRNVGDAVERHMRETISRLWRGSDVPAQPRWLFEDIERGRPVSVSQIFRAFAILAKSPAVSDIEITAAAESFIAMAISGRDERMGGLEELLVEETEAQAEADVLQVRAALMEGACQVTTQRALEATVRHGQAAQRVSRRLAAQLTETRVVRRRTQIAASRS